MPTKSVQKVQIQAKIFWVAHQDPTTGHWLGVCPPLNLNASGETYAELQACANEAMALLFLDLVEDGDLPAFMSKNGWKVVGPAVQPGRIPQFDIPADWKTGSRYEDLMAVHA